MREFFKKLQSSKGLTLIEVLIVSSLIIYTTISIIRNITASKINYDRVANVMASDIRLAQQLALSAHKFQGPNDTAPRNRCGYGITSDSPTSYNIYVGPPSSGNCGNPKFTGQDQPYYYSKSVALDPRLNFYDTGLGQKFGDIFFMPPGPSVYLDNSLIPINKSNADLSNQPDQIVIKLSGVKATGGPPGSSCQKGNPNCVYICVYGSGRVEVTHTYGVCP